MTSSGSTASVSFACLSAPSDGGFFHCETLLEHLSCGGLMNPQALVAAELFGERDDIGPALGYAPLTLLIFSFTHVLTIAHGRGMDKW